MESSKTQIMENMLETDDGFVWQDYLDATETIEVPQIMFPHVELTFQSGIEVGMSLEVPTIKSETGETFYWVATIVVACGPLLRMRYFGGDDRTLEFWFNLTKEAAHELGWCMGNNKKLEPPESVLARSPDCLAKLPEFLETAKSVPQEMLSGENLSMNDRIKQGMKVEVCEPLHPYKLWTATIIQNVGGRLLLRYSTPSNANASQQDVWIFCTSEHVHPHGFTARNPDSKWFLEPPSSIIESHPYEEWKELIDSGIGTPGTPGNLFNMEISHPKHEFEVEMKLEAVSPLDRTVIMPATVIKVYDSTYFVVQLDNIDSKDITNENPQLNHEKQHWLCTADCPYIFPPGWAEKNGLKLTPPSGWPEDQPFSWESYLSETKSVGATPELFPERQSALEAGFETGMRLEAIDPENENVICAAHITDIKEDLLWITLDNYKGRSEHIVHMHSMDIFPVGWCESNHYPLKPPSDYKEVCKLLETPEKKEPKPSILDIPIPEPRSSLWCPKIYFNYRCFTGPMVSKGKLATLPKAVGPGPVTLVMREVLSMIVSVGYSSARILKVLQCDTKPAPGYHLEVLKAKHKNKIYRANVAVVTSGDVVADFCRTICTKLMVCPNLFGPLQISENVCPDRCQKVSKTKFTSPPGSGKRGKPKGFASILVAKQKSWGRKRRKRGGRWATQPKEELENEEVTIDLPMDIEKLPSDELDDDGRPPLSEIDVMIEKSIKSDKSDDVKVDLPSSNASDDSRSSFNDRKSKDSTGDSLNSSRDKSPVVKDETEQTEPEKGKKRERDWEDSIESDGSEHNDNSVQSPKKSPRRPKTRKLDSNPLFWTVDDVFRYLRKTTDCKDIAHRVRQEEIDGLAFLLLNLPSLTEHMKLHTSIAMKLCRHVEQVKVTFFLRHVNEQEPEHD